MAKYDYGGGCACGLQAECDCSHGGKTVDRTVSDVLKTAVKQVMKENPMRREPFSDYKENYEETMPMARHQSEFDTKTTDKKVDVAVVNEKERAIDFGWDFIRSHPIVTKESGLYNLYMLFKGLRDFGIDKDKAKSMVSYSDWISQAEIPISGVVFEKTATQAYSPWEPPSLKGQEMNQRVPPLEAPNGLTHKDTNPKDAVGIRKPRFYSGMSCHVRRLVSIGMMEGAMKYGRHNYRAAGVRASVYYDATNEHLDDWYEGEDTDPDSKLNHVIKAICSLYVLADAIVTGNLVDDRPPRSKKVRDIVNENQPLVDELFRKYPNPEAAFTHLNTPNVKGSDEK